MEQTPELELELTPEPTPTTVTPPQKLNLYSVDGQKLEIHAQEDKVSLEYGQPIHVTSSLNVGTLVDLEAQVSTIFAGIASANTDLSSLNTSLSSSIGTVSADLASEVATRAAAVAALQSVVDTEKARIDALLAGSAINLNTLVELVAAYEAADTNILSTIGTMQTALTTLTARVDELSLAS